MTDNLCLALAKLTILNTVDINDQIATLKQYNIPKEKWATALIDLVRNTMEHYEYENSKSSNKRFEKITTLFSKCMYLKNRKIICWSIEGHPEFGEESTEPILQDKLAEHALKNSSRNKFRYKIADKNSLNSQTDTLIRMCLEVLSKINPSTDSTPSYYFRPEEVSMHGLHVRSSEDIIAKNVDKIRTEMQTQKEYYDEKFDKLTTTIEAILSKKDLAPSKPILKSQDEKKSEQLKSDSSSKVSFSDMVKSKKQKTNHLWTKVQDKKKNFTKVFKPSDASKLTHADLRNCPKKSASMVLIVSKDTEHTTIKSWFNPSASAQELNWFSAENNDVICEDWRESNIYDSKFVRVTVKNLPQSLNTHHQNFWCKFNIPSWVETQPWTGQHHLTIAETPKSGHFFIGNLQNTDFTEKIKNKLRENYSSDTYRVRVSKIRPRLGLKEADMKTSSYCASISLIKVGNDAPGLEEIQEIFGNIDEAIIVKKWRGSLKHRPGTKYESGQRSAPASL